MLTAAERASFDTDGFVLVGRLIDDGLVAELRDRFARLFRGEFETGTAPDEVNWQEGSSDPTLTRQICNGWKADRLIAATVLDARLGEAVACLAGWPGARIVQDNVLWKPPGARALGFHRDNAYLAWYTPREMFSCWIALDDTSAQVGTLELARGSHRWPTGADPSVQFHAPDDHRAGVAAAAAAAGAELDIEAVEVAAGSGAFHHGWTWHGSGPKPVRVASEVSGSALRQQRGSIQQGGVRRGQRPRVFPLCPAGRRRDGREPLPDPVAGRRVPNGRHLTPRRTACPDSLAAPCRTTPGTGVGAARVAGREGPRYCLRQWM